MNKTKKTHPMFDYFVRCVHRRMDECHADYRTLCFENKSRLSKIGLAELAAEQVADEISELDAALNKGSIDFDKLVKASARSYHA